MAKFQGIKAKLIETWIEAKKIDTNEYSIIQMVKMCNAHLEEKKEKHVVNYHDVHKVLTSYGLKYVRLLSRKQKSKPPVEENSLTIPTPGNEEVDPKYLVARKLYYFCGKDLKKAMQCLIEVANKLSHLPENVYEET